MDEEKLFDKHLGKKNEIELGGDKFNIKALGVEYLPHLLNVQSGFMSGMNEDMMGRMEGGELNIEDVKKIFFGLDDKAKNSMKTLIRESLIKSYPTMETSKLEEFGLMYGIDLIMHIMSINSGNKGTHEQSKRKRILEELNAKPVKQDKEQ